MAAHLLTRADIVGVSRKESERRLKFWLDEFGLNADPMNGKGLNQVFIPIQHHDVHPYLDK
jgi:hypothetical protein